MPDDLKNRGAQDRLQRDDQPWASLPNVRQLAPFKLSGPTRWSPANASLSKFG